MGVRARVVALVALVSLVAGAAVAEGTPSAVPRFEVLGHADTGDVYAGDVYGHGEYAYLSSYRTAAGCPALGVRVFDLREPRRPRLVARLADGRSMRALAGTWTEKTIVKRVKTAGFSGDLAVSSVQACRPGSGFQGFVLYDVTRPARPRLLASVPTEPRGSHEIWLATRGRRAYVYTAIVASELRSSPDGREPGRPDFRIFDVSSPRAPRQVGEWGAWRSLGLDPREGIGTGSLGRNLVHSVITNRAATRAFLSYWDLGTVILDIADPERPRYLGRTGFTADEAGNAHSAALARNETVLVETRETNGGYPALFDVSRPASPARLSTIRLTPQLLRQGRRGHDLDRVAGLDLSDSVHDARVSGTIAYFSWYRQGVVAVDISTPRRPRILARFLAPAASDRDGVLCPERSCRSVWGVYATRRYVLASDMLSGLWVLRLRDD